MIDQLTIRNFQSHRETRLRFHKGVNVIIGSSDSGKSAILRSLGWAIRNKSEDRGFRSRWGGKTDVELIFSDGKEVSRVQDKGNSYFLVDGDIDEEYKAFKSDIPEDIVNALNMGDINIQAQFDNPFLLSESSGEVSKILNKIANLTDIDTSTAEIARRVRANKSDITEVNNQINSLIEQQNSFLRLDEQEKAVVEWEQLNDGVDKLITNISQINNLITKTQELEKEERSIVGFLKAEAELSKALALVEAEKTLTTNIKSLQQHINNVQTGQSEIAEIKHIIKAESELNSVLADIEKLKVLTGEGQALQTLIKKIELSQSQIKACNDTKFRNQIQFDKLMPDRCPLCEQGVKK